MCTVDTYFLWVAAPTVTNPGILKGCVSTYHY
jgi:hypothetical protein